MDANDYRPALGAHPCTAPPRPAPWLFRVTVLCIVYAVLVVLARHDVPAPVIAQLLLIGAAVSGVVATGRAGVALLTGRCA